MNTDPEEFESLRKLLALKKYEKPPPGYFDQLPKTIWAKIEAEEAAPSWWERVFPAFTLKPSVAYAFGLAVCGALIIGIGTAVKTDPEQPATPALLADETSPMVIPTVAPSASSSTNPAMAPLIPPTKLEVVPVAFPNN